MPSAVGVSHRHQTSADGAKPIAAQQVQSQCPQQSQHLHPVALGVAMGVLAELGVAWPVPLVFDRPALPHKAQQRFGAGAQGGDEGVDVVKRLSVSPSLAHQLRDPARTHPALTDPVRGMAGREIADPHREVLVAAGLADGLLIEPP